MDLLPNENLITTKEAGERSGYTSDYLSRLVRSGKISGKKIGHSWLIDKRSLEVFLGAQGDHKIDRARELARVRAREYRVHRSVLLRASRALTEEREISPKIVRAVASFSRIRSHAMALSVALLVVTFGAVAAQAAAIPQLAGGVAAMINDVSYGFGETFGDIPHQISERIGSVDGELRSTITRVASENYFASEQIASPILAHPNLSLLSMPLEGMVSHQMLASHTIGSTEDVAVTVADVQNSLRDVFSLLISPSRAADALVGVYASIGRSAYGAIRASFSAYESLISDAGARTLAIAATTRDAVVMAPKIVTAVNLALGNAIIGTTHALIGAEVSLTYGIADAAPASARVAVATIGGIGNLLADTTARIAAGAPARALVALHSASEAGPTLARAIFDVEYAGATRFIAGTNATTRQYSLALQALGEAGYTGVEATRSLARSLPEGLKHTRPLSPNDLHNVGLAAVAAIDSAYSGALDSASSALDSIARMPKVAPVLSAVHTTAAPMIAAAEPAFSAGEQAALATYLTVNSWFRSTTDALASLFMPAPTIVYPTAAPQHPAVAVAPVSRTTNSYTTLVQGVSRDFVNESLASLRSNILATVAGMIQPVAQQGATNVTTIQQVNMIQDLSNLIVHNGDFRGGSLTGGSLVSATTGQFTNLTGGTTTLGGTTITGNLTVSGIITPSVLSAGSYIEGPYFVATSTTATSTFAGALAIGTTTPWGNGLFTIGTTTPLLYVERNSGRIGVGTSSPAVAFDIYATDAIRLPIGTTAQRPSTGDVGYVRYNTTTHQFEGFGDNSVWQGLGGVIDANQDTYITADTNNTNEDTLRFVTNSVERMTISPVGLIGMGTTSPYSLLSLSNSATTPANTPLFTIASTTGGTATSTLMTILANGRIGIGTNAPSTIFHISGTDGLIIPAGTTAQRPSSLVTGTIRYNSETQQFEGYGSSSWGSLGGVIDVNQDTKITAEDSAGANNDQLKFFTFGTERMRIDSNGLIGMGTTTPFANLSIAGSAGGSTNLFAISTSTAAFATTTALTINSAGDLSLLNGANLTVSGNTVSTGTLSQTGLATFTNGFISNASSTITSGLFTMSGGASTTNITASGQANIGSLAGASVSSLTANYLPKWNTGTFTNSVVYDDGTKVGIGTTNPGYLLDAAGIAQIQNYLRASYFIATSTTVASSFQSASSTAFSSLDYISVGRTATSTIVGDYGASSLRGALTVYGNTTTGAGSSLTLQRGSTNGDNTIAFNDQTGATLMKLYSSANSGYTYLNGYQSYLSLGTNTGGETLRIDTTHNARFTGNVIPTTNQTYDLGTAAVYWNNAYLNNVVANSFSAASTSIAGTNNVSFSIYSNNPTADTQDISLIFYRGAGAASNGVLAWNATDKRFDFNQNLHVSNADTSPASTTLMLQAVAGQTGALTNWLDSSGNTLATVSASGYLGLGTTTPGFPLSVEGISSLGNQAIAGYFTATSTTATSTFAGGLTVGTNKFVVNSFDGNVGFGTTSPSAPLDLNNGKSGIALWAVTGANYKKASLGYSDAVANDVFTIATNANVGGTYQDIQIIPNGGGSTNNGLYLNTSGQTGVGYTSFADTSIGNALLVNGRLGIGTTTPSNNLTVVANGRASGDLRYGLQIVNSDYANTQATNIAFLGQGGSGGNKWIAGTDLNHDNSSNFFVATSTGPGTVAPLLINSDSTIQFANLAATPVTTSLRLYEVGGALFFDGTQLTGGTASNYWSRSGGLISLSTPTDLVGVGSTTPFAKFAIHARNGETNTTLFAVASSTASATTTLFSISNVGTVSSNAIIPNAPYTNNLAAYDLGATGSRWNALWAGALNIGTSTFSITSDSASNLGFYTAASGGGTQAMTITSAGRIGIGTTTPGNLLHVVGGSSGTATAKIEAGIYPMIDLTSQNGDSSNRNWRLAGVYSNYGTFQILSSTVSGGAPTSARFAIDGNTGGVGIGGTGYSDGSTLPTNGLIVSGNVGIGTTTPQGRLHVDNQSTYLTTVFEGNGAAGLHGGIMNFNYASTNIGHIAWDISTNETSAGQFGIGTGGAYPIVFGTNNTAKMLLSSAGGLSVGNSYAATDAGAGNMIVSGNVGIGTTNPGYKFEVQGPSNATASQNIANFWSGPSNSYGLTIMQDAQDASDFTGGSIRDAIIRTNNSGLQIQAETNPIVFSTYASATWNPRMIILNNGNVGIGTTTPGATLHVSGTNPLFINTTSNNQVRFQVNGATTGQLYSTASTAFGVADSSGSLTRMVVDSSGNVGIGTTTPGQKLEVKGDILIDQNGNGRLQVNRGGTGNYGGVAYNTAYAQKWFTGMRETSDGDFHIYNNALGGDAVVIKDTTGNVGIGTTDPGAKLEVQGGNILVGNTTTRGLLQLVGTSGASPYVSYADNQTGGLTWLVGAGITSGGAFDFFNGSVDVMTLKSGNVGIGTTNPAYKFVVDNGAAVGTHNIALYNNANYSIIQPSTTLWVAPTTDNSDMYFSPGSSASVHVYTGNLTVDSGNVGIGTTAPESIFGAGGGSVGVRTMIYGSPSDNYPLLTLLQGSAYSAGVDKLSMLAFGALDSASTNQVASAIVGGSNFTATQAGTGYIAFRTKDSTYNVDNVLSEKVRITTTGNVGIGTTSPDMLLSVGSATPTGSVAHFENSTGSCYINPTTTALVCSSDARLKYNFNAISTTTALAGIEQLNPTFYNWKSEIPGTPVHAGFIAQQVLPIFPDLVAQEPDGFYAMNYAGLTPYLTAAVQALAAKIEPLAAVLTVEPGVESQCVVGETKLRRRKKRADGGYEEDEIAIADVVAGDEIQSLDERTNSVVYSRVNALLDMGEQEVYELVTRSGRRIRTTSNHPFLARLAQKSA